jgi:hypothetical protein
MPYTISIPDAAFAPGGRLEGIPPHKAILTFGIFGDFLTYGNEQLLADDASRTIAIKSDGSCCLQDEEMEGLSNTDRVVLSNLMHKGLAQVSKDGGAFLTPYALAHLTHL